MGIYKLCLLNIGMTRATTAEGLDDYGGGGSDHEYIDRLDMAESQRR
jgi:hypothetical protein